MKNGIATFRGNKAETETHGWTGCEVKILVRDCEFGPTGSRKGGRYGTRCQKGNYDELVFKRGSHAVSRELRLLVPYGRFMRDDTWVDWKRATGTV